MTQSCSTVKRRGGAPNRAVVKNLRSSTSLSGAKVMQKDVGIHENNHFIDLPKVLKRFLRCWAFARVIPKQFAPSHVVHVGDKSQTQTQPHCTYRSQFFEYLSAEIYTNPGWALQDGFNVLFFKHLSWTPSPFKDSRVKAYEHLKSLKLLSSLHSATSQSDFQDPFRAKLVSLKVEIRSLGLAKKTKNRASLWLKKLVLIPRMECFLPPKP